MAENLLEVAGLRTHFPILSRLLRRRVGAVRAVDGVDLALAPGEVLGIVGESGSGKTTVGKSILRLVDPTEGTIRFEGQDITRLPQSALMQVRRRMQVVFQDPLSSLNPRMTVGRILAAPYEIHGIARGTALSDRVATLLRLVGLPPDAATRYPHEFSGGQRKRVGIARAFALEPRLIIGDEPVSALDVSIQAQIMNLLKRLQREFSLSYIMISHNLGVVSHICDRVAVMYLGRIVESGPREALFFDPKHPYTQALLAALPSPEPGQRRTRAPLSGDMPSPANPPPGCPFHPRCPQAMARCATEAPAVTLLPGGHSVACHLHGG
jgi:oligopeptide/dipeptide ABC transporter ATP-binding protein